MKRKYFKPSKEIQNVFNQEWRRAKKILSPLLDKTDKPKFYIADLKARRWGIHIGNKNTFAYKLNGRFIRGSHFIVINDGLLWLHRRNDMIETIRHEIAHVLEQNHKARFKSILYQLTK